MDVLALQRENQLLRKQLDVASKAKAAAEAALATAVARRAATLPAENARRVRSRSPANDPSVAVHAAFHAGGRRTGGARAGSSSRAPGTPAGRTTASSYDSPAVFDASLNDAPARQTPGPGTGAYAGTSASSSALRTLQQTGVSGSTPLPSASGVVPLQRYNDAMTLLAAVTEEAKRAQTLIFKLVQRLAVYEPAVLTVLGLPGGEEASPSSPSSPAHVSVGVAPTVAEAKPAHTEARSASPAAAHPDTPGSGSVRVTSLTMRRHGGEEGEASGGAAAAAAAAAPVTTARVMRFDASSAVHEGVRSASRVGKGGSGEEAGGAAASGGGEGEGRRIPAWAARLGVDGSMPGMPGGPAWMAGGGGAPSGPMPWGNSSSSGGSSGGGIGGPYPAEAAPAADASPPPTFMRISRMG